MKYRIVFSTVCTNSYVVYLTTFLKSIIKHNPDFNIPFFVFHDDEFKKENKEKIQSIYGNVIFQEVDVKLYYEHEKLNVKFYSIESFRVPAQKCIYFGADNLCLRKIDEVFNLDFDIGMTKEKRRVYTFNNNCMVIGEKYINEKTYFELLKFNNYKDIYYGTDQRLYASYFYGKVKEVPQRFNTLVSEVPFIEWSEIIFLHYIYKPDRIEDIKEIDEGYITLWENYKNG